METRHDGSIACWGDDDYQGQAGAYHSLALRRDGGVACWGSNGDGQAPPAGVDGDFVAIAAGDTHSLALRRDGSVACWGRNGSGQAPPAGVDGLFGHVDV